MAITTKIQLGIEERTTVVESKMESKTDVESKTEIKTDVAATDASAVIAENVFSADKVDFPTENVVSADKVDFPTSFVDDEADDKNDEIETEEANDNEDVDVKVDVVDAASDNIYLQKKKQSKNTQTMAMLHIRRKKYDTNRRSD
jgi:hypothetical protein